MRVWLLGVLRRLALAWPIDRATKMQLASLAFRYFGPLFRGDPVYERFVASRRKLDVGFESGFREGSPDALIHGSLSEGFDLRPSQKARVTVLIPTYGQFHYSFACLQSIQKHRGGQAFRVVVVDDASGDRDLPLLGLLPGVTFICNAINLGFLLSCNHSLKDIDTEFIYLLNNDTEVCDGWLDRLVDVMDHYPDCGVVGSKLLSSDGRLQEAGGILWRDASAWNWGRGDDPNRYLYNFVRETDYVSGASMLIRSSLWKQLEGFDPRYRPAYCEDSDFAFRTREAGMRVMYQPCSVVVHHEGLSHGTDLNQGGKAYQQLNQQQFLDRWRSQLEATHFLNAQHLFLARDRSAGRRHVLFVDHYVPQPDRDAGSRTVFEFLKAICALGAHVTFWPHNGWYDPAYTPPLQHLGIEVVYGADAAQGIEQWLAQNAAYIDLAVLSRPDVFEAFEPSLRRFDIKSVIYYGHDIHFDRMTMQYRLNPRSVAESAIQLMQKRELEIWKRADRVLYPSDDEVKRVKSFLGLDSQRVQTIQPYVFVTHKDPPKRASRSDLIFVAGFAHPPNEDAACWLVESIMPEVWRVDASVRLKLVGSNPTKRVQGLSCDRVHVTGYVSDQGLLQLYNEAMLALVPLRFGAGVKNKVIEALAQGVPLVTTDVGRQGLPALEDVALIANTVATFAEAILGLLLEEHRWADQQRKGQAYAGRFSAAAMQDAWRALLA